MTTRQTQDESISALLETCTQMRVFLFETKRGGYNIYLFPNDVTQDVLTDYKDNYKFYVEQKDVVDYSQTEVKKETIQKLSISDLPQWEKIKSLIDNLPITNTPIFAPENVTKKIKMVVVECTINNSTVYLVSKFSYKAIYGRKIRFALFNSTFKKLNSAVLTLGDCIDCFIYNNEVYILLESHFNSLFDFHKRIKDEVVSNINQVNDWEFFNSNDEIANEVSDKPRKGRQFLKVINSESFTAWKAKTPIERKVFILNDEKLKDKFQFDDSDKIIYSKDSLNELFKLLTSDYYTNLLTGKTEER